MDDTHIQIKNFNLCIDKTHILRDLSVNIPRNKITTIIGPSGCGKSTLLRSINRLTDNTEGVSYSGSIKIDDLDIYSPDIDVTELRRKVGMIAQTPNPLPMSIYDNVIYGPRIHGLRDKSELNRIAENSLKSVGLWNEISDRLLDPASKLSLGQQQRLCLARSLANDPEILLCDETTSALDPISAKKVEDELRDLKKAYTILFVTHILRQAKRVADYVVFMYLGEFVEAGSAEMMFNNPHDPRTKQYIEGII